MKAKTLSVWVITAVVLCAGPLAKGQRPESSKGQDRIVKEVRHELVMLPYYSVFDNLAYKVDGSTVTLIGQVRTPSMKSDAEKAVSQIEGVDKVDNQIEVLPPSNTDDQIRRAVYYSLFSENSPLFRYGWGAVPPIHIIVSGGRVTLTGVVDSDGDKATAGLLAQKVPGTFSVTNNLSVGK
jgi:hyperosmotically inducible protein